MAVSVSPPPLNTQPLEFDEKAKRVGMFVSVWQQFFTNWWTALRAPANVNPPPTVKITIPSGGSFAFDQNFLYVSVGKNLWKKIPLQAL